MKITREEINRINELYNSGVKVKEVSKELCMPISTVQYHAIEKSKIKTIERAKQYSKANPRKNTERRREYMRNYMKDYYKKKNGRRNIVK